MDTSITTKRAGSLGHAIILLEIYTVKGGVLRHTILFVFFLAITVLRLSSEED